MEDNIWKDVVKKEWTIKQRHLDRTNSNTLFDKSLKSTFDKTLHTHQRESIKKPTRVRPKTALIRSKKNVSFSEQNTNGQSTMHTTVYGDFNLAKSSGLLKPETLVDGPKHFSDPPYMVIKPAFRNHKPMPRQNQLDAK